MRYLLISIACAALVVVTGASAQRSAGVQTGSATTSYIVVLKDNVANVNAKADSLGAALGFGVGYRYSAALKGFSASLTQAQAEALRADPSVEFLQVNGTAHAVAIKPGEFVPPGIRRIESAVGNNIKKKSTSKVAIIDTGIDLNQTDLVAQDGMDCINGLPAQDDNGHGTHVSGTVAARNQGAGVVGITPNTPVVAVKVLASNGSGSFAQVICGINWVAQNAKAKGIRVANMSLTGPGSDDGNCGNSNGDAMHRAVCGLTAAGVTLAAAAGNNSSNFAAEVPAAYNEALTVTAMADTDGRPGGLGPLPGCAPGNADDRFASFSNFAGAGSADESHTAAAPGVCVLSTRLGGGTTVLSGTSMASPHVAGTVANCIGHKNAPGPCANLTPAQIIQKIRGDAIAKGAAYGFSGDPNHAPPPGRYYGFLVSNLGY